MPVSNRLQGQWDFVKSLGPECACGSPALGERITIGALKTGVNPVKLARVVPYVRNPLAVDGPFHRMPAEFLIDGTGTITRAYYAAEIDDGIPIDDAVAWGQSASR